MNWPLLLAPSPAGGGPQSFLIQIVPFVLIIGIFWFLLIAPARRQRRQTQQMLDNLKAGDKILTSGGIYGTIVSLTDDIVRLRIANNVQVDVARSAITGRQAGDPA